MMARGITVRQPWAWAIAWGQKRIENRTQVWKYRGPLLIHAGSMWADEAWLDYRIGPAWWDLARDLTPLDLTGGSTRSGEYALPPPYRERGQTRHASEENEHPELHVVTSAIVAVTDLVDVHRAGPDCGEACESVWAETDYWENASGAGTGTHRTDVTHLVLADVRPCATPVPWRRGALNLWEAPDELVEQALAEAA